MTSVDQATVPSLPYADYFRSELYRIESRLSAYGEAIPVPIGVWLTFAAQFLTSARSTFDHTATAAGVDPLPAPPSPLLLETRLKSMEQALRQLAKEIRANDRAGRQAWAAGLVDKASLWVKTARELNDLRLELWRDRADSRVQ